MYKVGMGHKPPIPERLSLEGKDFLSHCLESEPRLRWTASQLLDHSFVKVRPPGPLPLARKQEGSPAEGERDVELRLGSVCGFVGNVHCGSASSIWMVAEVPLD